MSTAAPIELAHAHGPDRLGSPAELAERLELAERCAHDDPPLAARIAADCSAPAVRGRYPGIAARAVYLEARLAADRSEVDKALGLIDFARGLFEEAGQHLEALRTQLGRMAIFDEVGRHHESIAIGSALLDALDHLIPVGEQRELARLMRAMTANNLGVAYGEIGDHDRAMRHYATASNIYRSLGDEIKYSHAAANRGIEMLASGHAHEALQVFHDAVRSFTAAGDRLWAAKCGSYVARAQTELGDLAGALRTLESAREELRRLNAPAERARLQLAAAGVYLAVGLWREAHGESVAAAERLTGLGYTHDAAHARFTAACALLGAGDNLGAATELAEVELGYNLIGDASLRLNTLLVEAELRLRDGSRAEGRALLEKAVAELRAAGAQVPLIFALLHLTELVDDDRAAGALLVEAAGLVDQVGAAQLYALRDLHVSRWHRKAGRSVEAETHLRNACAGLENGAHQLPGPLLRMAFRANHGSARDELIDVLVDRGSQESVAEAWQHAHRIKAQTMRELAIGALGREPTLGTLAAHRSEGLTAVYRELAAAGNHALRKRVLARASAIERRVITAMIRRSARTTVAVSGSPATTGDELPQCGLLLEYHVSGRDVLAFVLHRGTIEVRRLPNARRAIASQLRHLRGEWSRFALGTEFLDRHSDALMASTEDIMRRLYQLLIEPIEPLLSGADSDELLIIPHRELYSVPFEPLLDGSSTLTQRYAITYSADTAVPPHHAMPSTPLVLATDDPDAPSVREEAAAIAAALPQGTLAFGADATVERLVEELPGPDLVHFACHASFRADNPMFSSLHLADQPLTTADILNLDLGGALVVLSACDAGRSATTLEPTGLTWAFLAAGASGVITSRWVIDDAVTAKLMRRLYSEIAVGHRPAVALRRAQSATAREHPHPYYWAAFSYIAGAAGTDQLS